MIETKEQYVLYTTIWNQKLLKSRNISYASMVSIKEFYGHTTFRFLLITFDPAAVEIYHLDRRCASPPPPPPPPKSPKTTPNSCILCYDCSAPYLEMFYWEGFTVGEFYRRVFQFFSFAARTIVLSVCAS